MLHEKTYLHLYVECIYVTTNNRFFTEKSSWYQISKYVVFAIVVIAGLSQEPYICRYSHMD